MLEPVRGDLEPQLPDGAERQQRAAQRPAAHKPYRRATNRSCYHPFVALPAEAALSNVLITVGPLRFVARFEEQAAPLTCAAFRKVLPFENRIIQARWSGEAAWVPMGQFDLGVPSENATSHPSRGDLLFYPAAASETEILFPYGSACFASKVGQLAGNHFLTVVQGHELLGELGRRVLWEGAQPIRIEAA